MCGIFGCISQHSQNLIDKTLQGLKILEYRGYDSAGITYHNAKTQTNTETKLTTIKSVGDIEQLISKVKNHPQTTVCIGHTRWATNGEVNINNSHPHLSYNNEIAVVHNGIIENYSECCDLLKANDIKLKTPVDTEVIPNILYLLHDNKHNIHKYLQGQYVFCATDIYSKNLFLAKKGNLPLYIGRDNDTIYITSDTLALPTSTNEIVALDDLDTCEIIDNQILFFKENQSIKKSWQPFNQSFIASDKNGFSTYMEKEINEIPDIMQRIISSYSTDKTILQQIQALRAQIKNSNCIHICGCGTSYHAALILSKVFEKELQIRTIAHVSSELNQTTLLNEKALAIVISQSGETADTLACMDILQNQKIPIIALCNITTSTIAKRSEITFPLLCGPEIAVASTKVFCAAILIGCLIIKNYTQKIHNEFIQNTRKTLQNARKILHFPNTNDFSKIFIIGKGIAHALALESALKIKEVSYIHCEGYPANELKHGPLSMVDTTTLAITIGDNVSNTAAEIQARGGTVINLPIDNKNPLNFIGQIIPVQIFALDLAQSKNINPDKPRNLAKSVTVL
ncbi:MAG: glutamine--fructose-6-phosphate transaminase (isomerizing) [Clostridia bacterium]|nr:glutamine--fructose-6-phosphate transaminase (isomerizing) [Clostridia bacterium]